jgi:curved DNA-binding protein CbpA
MELTLYAILGIPPNADAATIAHAYAARIGAAVMDSTIDRSTLTYAYLILSDARRRAAYDEALEHVAVARVDNVSHGDKELHIEEY